MSDERGRRIAQSYRSMAKLLAEAGMPAQARLMERDAERWENNPPAPAAEDSLVDIASTLHRIEELLAELARRLNPPERGTPR